MTAHAGPPRKTITLGWRLALSTSLIVTVVMGGVTLAQHSFEIRRERAAREELMAQALTPLATEIERAEDEQAAASAVAAFHQAHVLAGNEHHHMLLTDGLGNTVAASPGIEEVRGHQLHVTIPVVSAALNGGRGELSVIEDATEFEDHVARGWRDWWLHMLITVVTILIFLRIAIRTLVTRPLERLLGDIRRMEMGYWGDVETPSGAWEIRWLAWRFRNLGLELQRTIQLLVAAEKRGLAFAERSGPKSPRETPARIEFPDPPQPATDPAAHQRLIQVLDRLEGARSEVGGRLDLAQRVWDREAIAAERMGDMVLKGRLEDAALRILCSGAFREVEILRDTRIEALAGWVSEQHSRLSSVLEQEDVPIAALHQRVKHVAGIWRKMQSKELVFDQIHDLVAFRIIVLTEADCYWALGVLHRSFDPLLVRFKDYIAAPKANGYQSLHTTLRCPRGMAFEVQIRSMAMHRQAEKGTAAHWQYKDDASTAPASVDGGPYLDGRSGQLPR